MMDEEFDINAEYEKLHGPMSPRKMLFDEEEYELLRKQIVDAPKNSYNKLYAANNNKFSRLKYGLIPLPFAGVKLLTEYEWWLNYEIEVAKKRNRHLYYLKEESDNSLKIYAVGYYDDRQDGGFVVIKGSYTYLSPQNDGPADLSTGCSQKSGDIYCEKAQCRYKSSSIAARRYLGEKASSVFWTDDDGRCLPYDESCLVQLTQTNNAKQTELSFTQDEGKKLKKRFLFDEVIYEKGESTSPNLHIFRLLLGVCDARGYFLPEDGVFYVCAGSIVDEGLEITPKRQRFLDKSCEKTARGWKVIKDAKCISATAAARYVTGREVDYTLWKDSNGKYLKDYYPNYFFIGGTPDSAVKKPSQSSNGNDTSERPKIRWGAHAFYLRTSIGESDVYDAKGYYDPTSGQFTIKEGSLLSLTTKAIKFDQSAVGRLRVNVINENCTRERTGYRLKADEIFKDPIYAASVVMGKTVNGWNMWKDSKGYFLAVYAL